MTRLRLVVLAALVACAKQGPPAAADETLEPLSIHEVGALRGITPSVRARRLLEVTAAAEPPLRAAYAVAVLYPRNPQKWADALYEHFAIHDAAARADRDVVVVDPKDVQSSVRQAQLEVGQSVPLEVGTLKAFMDWRDARSFVVTPTETVDVARTLRAATLDTLWSMDQDAGRVNVGAVLDALDARARAEAEVTDAPEVAPAE